MIEVKRFFEDYKSLEKKTVTVEDFLGRLDAYAVIEKAIDLYRTHKEQLILHERL